jgi:hypothetical protein
MSMTNTRRGAIWFWGSLAAVLFASRACHLNILWADEDYHLAAAIQMLHGKMLYRDLWYDKPPLNAMVCLLFGAWPGWPLRIAASLIAIAGCVLSFRFAARLWGPREGFYTAALLAFFLIFYSASATIPLEPDTLMIVPHIAAVYLAWRQKPLAAGGMAGLAFLVNTKGVFVLAACVVFVPAGWLWLALGFLVPNAAMLGWLAWNGALPSYFFDVWRWGFIYAGAPPPNAPNAAAETFGWLGFHAVLVIGAILFWRRETDPGVRLRLAIWTGISLLAAAIGWRFSPRYFNQLLPALTIMAARGISVASREPVLRLVLAALMVAAIIPLGRFGPRYVELAADDLASRAHTWRDVAMDQESRRAAEIVNGLTREGDTIFVWGYRPNLIVYTRLPVASWLWDSQLLTGVPADRHLSDARPVAPEWAQENRRQLVQTSPTFLVDGLSTYNRDLDIHNYPDLADWLGRYCVAGRAGNTTVYRLCERPSPTAR